MGEICRSRTAFEASVHRILHFDDVDLHLRDRHTSAERYSWSVHLMTELTLSTSPVMTLITLILASSPLTQSSGAPDCKSFVHAAVKC